MSQRLAITCRGLVTAPNPLAIPKDALAVADNIVIDRPGLIQSRRGFAKTGDTLGGSIWKLFEANGSIFANWGTASEATTLSRRNGTSWVTVTGDVTNQPASRMRVAEANGFAYLTCEEGPRRLLISDMEFAGVPKSLGIDKEGPAAVLSSSAPTFLPDGHCAAYRAVIGQRLANDRVLLGAPSSRTVIYNASTTNGYTAATAAKVTARVLLPPLNNTTGTALTEDHFVQLYRSAEVAATVTPDDDLQLVSERFLTPTDISNGYVDMIDGTPDSFRGAHLYTNPNVGGDEGLVAGVAGVANDPPPNAIDVALWRDCLWYAGTTSRHRLAFQILGTGTGGLTAGHTLTIASLTYTAIAPGAPAAQEFVVETGGNAAQNIEETAQNLVAAINKDATNSRVFAFYVSGESPDAPGKILLERRTLAQTSFTVQASANGKTGYVPALDTAISSTQDVYPDALCFSRAGLPEAVPSVNQMRVGSGATILKIAPLRGSLFVFTDKGLYRVVGDTFADFAVREFDLSAVLLARECVAMLDDDLYAWCENGVARINEGGVEWLSGDIDFDLQALMQAATRDELDEHAFMVAQPQDHRVLLWFPRTASDGIAREAYCLCTRTSAWVKWFFGTPLDANPDGRSSGVFSQAERKLYLSNAQVADCAVFIEGDLDSTTDILSDDRSVGPARTVTWAPQDDGNPGLLKHWTEAQILLGDNAPSALLLTFDGDFASDSVSVTGIGSSLRLQRMPVGRAAGRGTRLSVSAYNTTAGDGFDIAGLSLFCRPLSSRGMK